MAATDDGELATAFDDLIARGPLRVAFQPIVDLVRGAVLGYEVLGRCGPVEGPLADAVAAGPSAMLELAYRHDRLLALDRRWRSLAIARIAARPAGSELSWFLNVDPRVADMPGFASGFTHALVREHGLDPSRFVLELTEAVARDPITIERVLAHYARQGFRVAIDDLGAGQQSFATLLRIQPQIVKLDRLLLEGIDADPSRRHLLSALGEFARRNGTIVIAEGVETAAQLEIVLDAGVRHAQGFWLGSPEDDARPIAADRRDQLARRRWTVGASITEVGAPEELLLHVLASLRGASGELETMLQHVTAAAAELLHIERTSLRLLDDSRRRLLLASRYGAAIHSDGDPEFEIGEGLAGWIAARGEMVCVDDAELDARFVAKPGQSARLGAFLGVPLLDRDGVIGVLSASSPVTTFSPSQVRWLRVLAAVATPYLEIARLQRLAVTDELTLALNRRALEGLIPAQPRDAGEPLCVVLFDIDRFKAINDRLGHAAGDEVLRAVPRIVRAMSRRGDELVRLGGDEFVLVLRGATTAAATSIAERACKAVRAAELVADPVTLSAGVAERGPAEHRDALLARADLALYRAKAEGRDRVAVAEYAND